MPFSIRQRTNTLSQALQLLEASAGIVRRHNKNKDFMPTQDDFETLAEIERQLFKNCMELEQVTAKLRLRVSGQNF